MAHGGAREGAGRKRNIPNKASQKRQAEVARTGETPLAYMLRVMRDQNVAKERRDEMAKAAAPYVHPRLSSVEHNDITPRRNLKDVDARLSEFLGGVRPQAH